MLSGVEIRGETVFDSVFAEKTLHMAPGMIDMLLAVFTVADVQLCFAHWAVPEVIRWEKVMNHSIQYRLHKKQINGSTACGTGHNC